ncbi:endonuclease SmrB [Aliiglaciecola litoralis]|uniref:Ribosome rescue factor SmrB n=1 Tax=Aliiglaciecola litoralis TaxID=582857 RepID=A0ABN1LPG9_9ALTE
MKLKTLLKSPPQDPDDTLFKTLFRDVKPIKQDKITPPRKSSKGKTANTLKKHQADKELKRASASFHFSDGFEAHFPDAGPLKYVKPGVESYQVKQLRRGEYAPELILDLHGLNKEQAKLEIAALIVAAQKQHVDCVCIVHGVGGNVLKKAVPNWLIQHPAVTGFHQAPLEWGGRGALLVLLENSSLKHSDGKL